MFMYCTTSLFKHFQITVSFPSCFLNTCIFSKISFSEPIILLTNISLIPGYSVQCLCHIYNMEPNLTVSQCTFHVFNAQSFVFCRWNIHTVGVVKLERDCSRLNVWDAKQKYECVILLDFLSMRYELTNFIILVLYTENFPWLQQEWGNIVFQGEKAKIPTQNKHTHTQITNKNNQVYFIYYILGIMSIYIRHNTTIYIYLYKFQNKNKYVSCTACNAMHDKHYNAFIQHFFLHIHIQRRLTKFYLSCLLTFPYIPSLSCPFSDKRGPIIRTGMGCHPGFWFNTGYLPPIPTPQALQLGILESRYSGFIIQLVSFTCILPLHSRIDPYAGVASIHVHSNIFGKQWIVMDFHNEINVYTHVHIQAQLHAHMDIAQCILLKHPWQSITQRRK